MLIDAHQHFWEYSPAHYPWISESMDILQRDYLPSDLLPLLRDAGLHASIVVQARQSEVETDWLLALAARHDFVCGVVGWIDLCAPDLERRLARYATTPWLKGFRHVLQDETDDRYMLRPSFLRGLREIARHGYCYDILVFPRQLSAVIECLDRLPEMPLVIDHIAKPAISNGEWQPWADELRLIASFPHVYCKLSGMLTQSTWPITPPTVLSRYMEHVLDVFGANRLIFGSDWPVCTLAASYQKAFDVVSGFVRQSAPGHVDAILGRNAQQFYSIPDV